MDRNQQAQQWTQYIEIKQQPSSPEKLDSILEKRLKAFIAKRLADRPLEKARQWTRHTT